MSVASVTRGREAYGLAPLFREPLRDISAIAYRHDVFRDLEDEALRDALRGFSRQFQAVQRRLDHVGKTTYNLDRQRWLLGAAHDYGAAVRELDDRLRQTPLRSAGLSAFRDHLAAYVVSDAFGKLMKDTDRVQARLEVVSYRLRVSIGPRSTPSRGSDPSPTTVPRSCRPSTSSGRARVGATGGGSPRRRT